MKNAKQLIDDALKNVKLNILVFGPQVAKFSPDVRIRHLQDKRIQIRQELELLGHDVKYAEDLVDPNLPSALGNAFLQEIVIMAEVDLIFNLVDQPGSITEASLIASRPNLALKSSLFLDDAYKNGLPAESCRAAEIMGAEFRTYNYPVDLVDCNLLTFIVERVKKAQFVKMAMI